VIFVVACASQEKIMTNNPLLDLATIISSSNQKVIDRVSYFNNSQELYFEHYNSELVEQGIDDVDEVTAEVVLVDALLHENLLVYVDWKQEPDDVLEQLVSLSKGRISNCESYANLLNFYRNTEYGVGHFLDTQGDWPSIFNCIGSVGLKLLAIDEDSDGYALILVEHNSLDRTLDAFEKANVRLYSHFAE